MTALSSRDKAILCELQRGLPLAPRPFKALAKRHGLTEGSLIKRLRCHAEQGLIRRMGIIFNLPRLGVKSSLIGMHVPRKRIDAVAKIVNSYPQVSHHYERDDHYNLWWTISAPSSRALTKLIREISDRSDIQDVLDLRTEKAFKMRAVFELP